MLGINQRASVVPLLIAFGMILLLPTLAAGEDGELLKETVEVSVQGVSVDSQDDRDGGFDKYRDDPDGFTLDFLHLANLIGENGSFMDFRARDAGQEDGRYLFRAGVGSNLRIRFDYRGVPFVYGNRARNVLGRVADNEFRIADFIQQQMEDPDGNGVPFFSEAGGAAGDNALVQAMMRGLVAGTDRFDVTSRRRMGNFQLDWRAGEAWTLGLEHDRQEHSGVRPLGNGAYQRITDVDGDGSTDYDYFFSNRGIELQAPADYTTDTTRASARYSKGKWFGDFSFNRSDFENDDLSLIYDNPAWFTDTLASSGSRRGLWEESRVSLAPSNEAWSANFSGGVKLGDKTRLTAAFGTGEQTQDAPFVPITTNTALIGTKDLNHDGVTDSRDDPTTTAILPQQSLDASIDTTNLSFRLTSSPSRKARLKAEYSFYEYDGAHSTVDIPARAEYNDSRLKTDIKGAGLLSLPYFYERERLGAEGIFTVADGVKVSVKGERNSKAWNRYRDLNPSGSFTRDEGNRSVSGTDDDLLGLALVWKAGSRVQARASVSTSERTFTGEHQVAFNGQKEDLRQYDIADRDRDAYEVQFDFFPSDRASLTLGAHAYDDTFPGSEYGFTSASEEGYSANGSFSVGERSTAFFLAEVTSYDSDMHLRTKCSNCTPPPGATWTSPWNVPNYDWFTNYADDSLMLGGGLSFESDDEKVRFDLEANYLDAEVSQLNRNPAPPRDLGKPDTPVVLVAQAFDFPDQTNTMTSVELRCSRRLREHLRVAFSYLYEDWQLDDFQVENLQAYGADFLLVDDSTRYLTLDSWFGDYEASVAQVMFIWNK